MILTAVNKLSQDTDECNDSHLSFHTLSLQQLVNIQLLSTSKTQSQFISKDSNKWINKVMHVMWVGRDSSVSIVTGYGLGSPRMVSRWGQPDRPCGSPRLLYIWYQVFPREVKRPGCGIDHPPPYSAEVKERVELYLYSTSGPSWPVTGWTLCMWCAAACC